jgi:FKBP-type peptidyl-prolyl cis-trans isomerase FkpA
MNTKTITPAEWWTLGVGAAIIILIIILMTYTGSTAGSSNQSSGNASTTTINSTAASVAHSVAQNGDTVTVEYTGTLADGTVFDSSKSHGQPFSFVLGAGQVIAGWDKGVLGMKVGETKTLVIPPADAYGARGVQNPSTGKYIIPANATLTFQVQLLSTESPAK